MATLYRYYNEYGHLLYVGRTGVGRQRASAHARVAEWWNLVATAEFFHADTSTIALCERLAIWTERPPFNRAGRVSTASRQAMLALLAEHDPQFWIRREDAARILGLSYNEIGVAVWRGFLRTDFPRVLKFSHEQLATFIGTTDRPDDTTTLIVVGREFTPRRESA